MLETAVTSMQDLYKEEGPKDTGEPSASPK